MSKIFKGLPILVVATFFLLACGASSQGSTSPITPTAVVATATEIPFVMPSFATAAPTPTSSFYQMQEVVISDPALAQSASADTFSPLVVTVTSDASQALAQYDASGWPTAVTIPTDRLYFALRCESPAKVWAGFFLPEDRVGDQPVFVANCSGRIELLVLHPEGVGHYTAIAQGNDGIESQTQQGIVKIQRWKFTSLPQGQVVAWYNK